MDDHERAPSARLRWSDVGDIGADAAASVRAVLGDELLDAMVARMRGDGVRLSGPGGFLTEMLKALLERGLAAELTPASGLRQARPGRARVGQLAQRQHPKTVLTEVGPVALDVPRDRAGTFTPALVRKGERRPGPVIPRLGMWSDF